MENTKIRMIFCDVDGTLLPKGQHEISPSVFNAIKQSLSSNISFVIASGRSFPDLKRLFLPVANDVTFICNDGALTIDRNEVLYSAPLNKAKVACMAKTYKNDYDAMVLYAKDYTYFITEKDFSDVGIKISNPSEILSIPGDIFKIAFYNLSQNAKIKIDNLGIKSGILNNVYSDKFWTEYISANINKGVAAEKIQTKYGISVMQTAAFGDNTNDRDMLKRSRVSFSAPHAHPEIVRICKYKTNNVTNEILNIIEKGDQYE